MLFEIKMKKDAGWKKFQRVLTDAGNKATFEKHVHRATMLNGKVGEAFVRKEIKEGNFERNAPLTLALKKGTKPLIGNSSGAQLFQSITSKALGNDSFFVGVLKTNSFYNVAKILHEGTSIPVTNAMRMLFFTLWAASSGKMDPAELSPRGQELYSMMSSGWLPLKKTTKQIVIPPRPFISQAMENIELQQISENNWKKAADAAFKEIVGKQ